MSAIADMIKPFVPGAPSGQARSSSKFNRPDIGGYLNNVSEQFHAECPTLA